MDETTLRGLGARLLVELPTEIADSAERQPVADDIRTALTKPEGGGRQHLLDALSSHPATRDWMRRHGAVFEDVDRSWDLQGLPTGPLGLYYVCPKLDHDDVLEEVPVRPPLCPVHEVPMIIPQD